MTRLSLAKFAAAIGGTGLALSAATGVATASPDDAVINTTCSYPQVIAALNDSYALFRPGEMPLSGERRQVLEMPDDHHSEIDARLPWDEELARL